VKNIAVRLLLVVVAIVISVLLMLLAAYAISFMLNGDASALDVTTNG
jgi:ABC-type glycerol-3-phosphate transport system permease component